MEDEKDYMSFKRENLDNYILHQGITNEKFNITLFRSDYAKVYFPIARGNLKNVLDRYRENILAAHEIIGRINKYVGKEG